LQDGIIENNTDGATAQTATGNAVLKMKIQDSQEFDDEFEDRDNIRPTSMLEILFGGVDGSEKESSAYEPTSILVKTDIFRNNGCFCQNP
jgi:hypothetical protein